MKASDVVARARSAVGLGIKYRLGSGGMKPSEDYPSNISNECDCSGFVCWTLGISRYQPAYPFNGGWVNTDSMVADAYSAVGFFAMILPRPGAVIVYGRKGKTVGHCGIISGVDSQGRVTKVIHCSAGNYRRTGDAIAETDAALWMLRKDSVCVWYAGLDGV